MNPFNFFKEVREELRRVQWPSRSDVVRLTGSVMVISLFFGIFIGSLDYILAELVKIMATSL